MSEVLRGDISRNIHAALSTPQGEAVANFLREIVASPVYNDEPMAMAYKEGRRMLALEILNHADAVPVRVLRGGRT